MQKQSNLYCNGTAKVRIIELCFSKHCINYITVVVFFQHICVQNAHKHSYLTHGIFGTGHC